MPDDSNKTISKQTTITLGVGIIVAAGVWTASATWNNMVHKLDSIVERLSAVEKKLEDTSISRWRADQMDKWAYRLAEENESLWVPDPTDPHLERIKITNDN